MNSILDQDIMFLPGVGPKKKEILSKELGINSYSDLLEYYPYKYVDRSKVFHISELNADMPFVQLKGKILSYDEIDTGKRNKLLVAHFSDGYGVADLIWYRGAQYIMKPIRWEPNISFSESQPSSTADSSLPIPTWTMPPISRFQRWACSPTIRLPRT